jgi:hypothetical protein
VVVLEGMSNETIPAPAADFSSMQDTFALADTVWPGADTELCQCELEGYNFTELLLGALKAPAAKAVPAVIGM